jgi:hypothetical protein
MLRPCEKHNLFALAPIPRGALTSQVCRFVQMAGVQPISQMLLANDLMPCQNV